MNVYVLGTSIQSRGTTIQNSETVPRVAERPHTAVERRYVSTIYTVLLNDLNFKREEMRHKQCYIYNVIFESGLDTSSILQHLMNPLVGFLHSALVRSSLSIKTR